MSETKTAEEIAKTVYPISRKENHITSVKLHNKRVLKIDAFVKGYNYANQQNQERQRQLDLKIIGYDDLYSKYTQLKQAAHDMACELEDVDYTSLALTNYKRLTNKP
jgi:hypothetical protein